jgi:hypothetical protein
VGTSNLQGYNAGVITYNRTGTYTYDFTTSNSGTTISVFDASQNQDPIYLPSSQSMSGTGGLGAVFLTTTATYFDTGVSAASATLAPGVNGQIKTIMMSADGGGDMVVTVTNPAWGGAGTITFDTVGDAVTLQYINSKWFCIGNNGTVFA